MPPVPVHGRLRTLNLAVAALLLGLLIAYVIVSFAVNLPPYDYWLLMNGADWFCFQPEAFQYGKGLHIYYPAPFYSTFCLPYHYAEPLLRWAGSDGVGNDLFSRVGAFSYKTAAKPSCLRTRADVHISIEGDDVSLDNTWIWHADHDDCHGLSDTSHSKHGLHVSGNFSNRRCKSMTNMSSPVLASRWQWRRWVSTSIRSASETRSCATTTPKRSIPTCVVSRWTTVSRHTTCRCIKLVCIR